MAKKKNSPLRRVPGTREKNLGQALDAFAAGAGRLPDETVHPWEEDHVRDDVMKQLLLKMPEPLYLKLKHIASYTPYNMTSFILEKLSPEIEKEIARLTGRPGPA